ncbi:unnamed protein product, partial [Mesorhabditis belari]|uniref:L-xylulose reductase n=1 Tax=Mesorhabditis belari TaxID=2138241 RepID=A0AAF3F1N8_9BILA
MSVSFDFTGKKILVTGGSQGIGLDISKRLAKSGARVYALARNETALKALVDEFPTVTPIVCDVSAKSAVIEKALKPHHPFDGLVNNAGIAILQPALDADQESIDKILTVNLRAPIVLAGIIAKEMISNGVKGSIVNMSSQASLRPIDDHIAYCSSKAGLDMATRVMAREWGKSGIRVNTVNPTVVLTEMGKKNWSDKDKAGPLLQQIPLGHFAEPNDVTSSVLFLLSDSSSLTTGSALPVDGGYSAN